MRHRPKFRLRALSAVVVAGLATVGLAATGAGAQTGDTTGVTDKDVTLGYISSQTGVAVVDAQERGQGVPGAVDAENAKGGVNGRKIKLEVIDDASSGGGGNLTAGGGPRPEPRTCSW